MFDRLLARRPTPVTAAELNGAFDACGQQELALEDLGRLLGWERIYRWDRKSHAYVPTDIGVQVVMLLSQQAHDGLLEHIIRVIDDRQQVIGEYAAWDQVPRAVNDPVSGLEICVTPERIKIVYRRTKSKTA